MLEEYPGLLYVLRQMWTMAYVQGTAPLREKFYKKESVSRERC